MEKLQILPRFWSDKCLCNGADVNRTCCYLCMGGRLKLGLQSLRLYFTQILYLNEKFDSFLRLLPSGKGLDWENEQLRCLAELPLSFVSVVSGLETFTEVSAMSSLLASLCTLELSRSKVLIPLFKLTLSLMSKLPSNLSFSEETSLSLELPLSRVLTVPEELLPSVMTSSSVAASLLEELPLSSVQILRIEQSSSDMTMLVDKLTVSEVTFLLELVLSKVR